MASVPPPPSSHPDAERPRRRVGRGLLFLALSLVVIAALLELYARWTFDDPLRFEEEHRGMYASADDGGIRTVPGFEGRSVIDGREVSIRLNELGMRDDPIPPRRANELRVLFLGDSWVFGQGVEADETFAHLTEEKLAERLGRPVTCGNAGVPGYGTIEESRCLARLAPRFGPDVVVGSIYLGNDFIDDRILTKYIVDGYSFNGPWARLMRRSARARFMLVSRFWMKTELTLMKLGSPLALQADMDESETDRFDGFPPKTPQNQQFAGIFMDAIDEGLYRRRDGQSVITVALDRIETSIREMQASCPRATFLFIVSPTWWHVIDEDRVATMIKVGLDPDQYRVGLTQARLAARFSALEVESIDMTPALRAHPDPKSLFLPNDKHLSPAGHRVYAEDIAGRLAAMIGG